MPPWDEHIVEAIVGAVGALSAAFFGFLRWYLNNKNKNQLKESDEENTLAIKAREEARNIIGTTLNRLQASSATRICIISAQVVVEEGIQRTKVTILEEDFRNPSEPVKDFLQSVYADDDYTENVIKLLASQNNEFFISTSKLRKNSFLGTFLVATGVSSSYKRLIESNGTSFIYLDIHFKDDLTESISEDRTEEGMKKTAQVRFLSGSLAARLVGVYPFPLAVVLFEVCELAARPTLL